MKNAIGLFLFGVLFSLSAFGITVIPLNGVGVTVDENYSTLKFGPKDSTGSYHSLQGSVFSWTSGALPQGRKFAGVGGGIMRYFWIDKSNWSPNKGYRVAVKQTVSMKQFAGNPGTGMDFESIFVLTIICPDASNSEVENTVLWDHTAEPAGFFNNTANWNLGPTISKAAAIVHDFAPGHACSAPGLWVRGTVQAAISADYGPIEVSVLEQSPNL